MNVPRRTALRRIVGSLVIAAMVTSLGACGSAQRKADKIRDLSMVTTTDAYRKLVRWGDWEEASFHLKARKGELRKPALKRYKPWKITSYNVGEVVRDETGNEARVTAQIEFYSTDTGHASSMKYEQLWWYDAEAKHWYLDGSLPDFDGETRFPK
jgi:hypothetical protein